MSKLAQPANLNRIAIVGAALTAGAALLLLMPTWATSIAEIYPLPDRPLRMAAVYVAAVIGLSGSTVLLFGAWLAPSWAIASRLGPEDSLGVRALRTVVVAFVLQPAAHALFLASGLSDADPATYRLAAIFLQLAVFLIAVLVRPRAQLDAPQLTTSRPRWIVFASAYLLFCGLLLPRLAWEDFNPDGLELLTAGRSLSHFVLARLPTGELPGVSLGMATVAYPVHWAISFLGTIELSARLPFVMYSMLVALGTIGLIEARSPRRLTTSEFALVVAGALGVCLTLGLNSSYDPYSTDLASPASIDILALALLLSACHFLLAGEAAWAITSAVLLTLTRPSGPLLCALLAVALFVTARGNGSRWRIAVGMTIAAFAVSALYALGMKVFGVGPMAEGADNLASRLRYLRFDDWRRWLWLIVPSGIVPAIVLLRVRTLGPVVRALGLVTLGYFALFYSLAFVALHHFAPVMLLPVVAYWLWVTDHPERAGPRQRTFVAAGLVAAAWAALPNRLEVFRANSEVGSEVDYRVGTYDGGYTEYRTAFEGRTLLDSLFAPYWRDLDALPERTAGAWVLIHYGARSTIPPAERQYSVRELDDRSLSWSASQLVTQDEGIGLFVADSAAWLQQRRTPPAAAPLRWIYAVPRHTLFRHLGVTAGAYQIDLRSVLDRFRPR